MIIKNLRWHTTAFGRLISYVGKEIDLEDSQSIEVRHNLRPGDLQSVTDQFRENDSYRKKRVRGVTAYHEILSFHQLDSEHLTPEVLEDITREYLSIRAPDGIAFASSHHDKEHTHIHIALHGVEYGSPQTLRMDRPEFNRVRRETERYQREQFPELEHSLVHGQEEQELLQEIEAEIDDRRQLESAYRLRQMEELERRRLDRDRDEGFERER